MTDINSFPKVGLVRLKSILPKFDSKTDKRMISFRPNGRKCYNESAVRLAFGG